MKHVPDEKLAKWQDIYKKFNQHGVIEPMYTEAELRTVLANVLENQSRLGDKEPDFGKMVLRVLQ